MQAPATEPAAPSQSATMPPQRRPMHLAHPRLTFLQQLCTATGARINEARYARDAAAHA
jgi:hypothetical protein